MSFLFSSRNNLNSECDFLLFTILFFAVDNKRTQNKHKQVNILGILLDSIFFEENARSIIKVEFQIANLFYIFLIENS